MNSSIESLIKILHYYVLALRLRDSAQEAFRISCNILIFTRCQKSKISNYSESHNNIFLLANYARVRVADV